LVRYATVLGKRITLQPIRRNGQGRSRRTVAKSRGR
jgi:hypothetical protein